MITVEKIISGFRYLYNVKETFQCRSGISFDLDGGGEWEHCVVIEYLKNYKDGQNYYRLKVVFPIPAARVEREILLGIPEDIMRLKREKRFDVSMFKDFNVGYTVEVEENKVTSSEFVGMYTTFTNRFLDYYNENYLNRFKSRISFSDSYLASEFNIIHKKPEPKFLSLDEIKKELNSDRFYCS